MAHELAVLSPEKTIVTYRIAGLATRIVAQLLDWFLIIFVTIGVSMFASVIFPYPYDEALTAIVGSIGWLAYFTLMEGLNNGQTLGKFATNIRVRMSDGTPVTFLAAAGRSFLRIADMMPPGLGILAIFSNPKGQRLGDFAANTIVVMEKRGHAIFVERPHEYGQHPLEAEVGDLRTVTLEEYVTLRQFCDRFPYLPTTVQNKLMREVWLPIAQRRNIPVVPGAHPVSIAEAVVMKIGRERGLL